MNLYEIMHYESIRIHLFYQKNKKEWKYRLS